MPIFDIIVCAGIVPDPLQTLEPETNLSAPMLKNETMLPSILDPWAMHALIEGADLARRYPGSRLFLVSIAPKAKLQQVMMTVGQKVSFQLIAIDAGASGWTDPTETAKVLCTAIQSVPELDLTKTLLFGGWESAARGYGSTMQILGEMLGITEQFQGVDRLTVTSDTTFEILERIEGGIHQLSELTSLPAVLGWATGDLAEPFNNPQIGMLNMRSIMPAIQKAAKVELHSDSLKFVSIETPKQKRDTQVITDMSVDEIAADIVSWLQKD